MSEQRNLVYTNTMSVRWGDLDANGHVNNTTYFRFFEEARVSWLESLSLKVGGAETGPVIIKTEATFLRELGWPSTVEVRTYAGKAGRSSLDTYHEVVDQTTGDICCEGYAKIVWLNHLERKSTALPDALRQLAAE